MKTLRISVTFIVAMMLFGCSEEAPKATNEDKANIERLAKEGIGARPVDGGAPAGGGNPAKSDQPAKTAEDAQPAPP